MISPKSWRRCNIRESHQKRGRWRYFFSSTHLPKSADCRPGRVAVAATLSERIQQIIHRGVVAKGLADVGEAIHVARTKDEAAAELEWTFKLEWIFAQSVLAVPGSLGALARLGVVGAEQVEEIRFAKSGGLVHLATFVNEQGEGDLGLLAEVTSVISAAEPDSGKVRSLQPEFFFSVAQLRDMLTAEDSTPVAQKNHDRGLVRPERAKLHGLAIDVGQSQGRQGSGERHSSSLKVSGYSFKREKS